METLADLIAYKERKAESVSQKKEHLKTLNSYFSEHKYAIMWAQVNPFVKGEKNSLSPYIDGLLSVVPPQVLGLKPADIGILTANTSPTAVGLLLGKIALRAIVKRFKNKSTKRKKKKAPDVAEKKD